MARDPNKDREDEYSEDEIESEEEQEDEEEEFDEPRSRRAGRRSRKAVGYLDD